MDCGPPIRNPNSAFRIPDQEEVPIPPRSFDPAEAVRDRLQRGEIPLVLCIHGDDEGRGLSLVEQVRGRCMEESTRAFNENVFDALETPMGRVILAARTLPMMSAWRVVLVNNASHLSKADWDTALPYLKDPCPSTCLIFRGHKLTMSAEATETIRKGGAMVELRPRSERQAQAWLVERVRREGKVISSDAARALVERVGTLEGELEGEAQKLVAFVGAQATVEEEDVRQVAAEVRSHRVFDLTDALGEQRTADGLKILHRLLEEGSAPLGLLGMMARQVRLLWFAGESVRGGRGRSDWVKRFSVKPFLVDKLAGQARNWDAGSLRKALLGLAQIDRSMKSGKLDPEILLDQWVLRMGRRDPRETSHGSPASSEPRRGAGSFKRRGR